MNEDDLQQTDNSEFELIFFGGLGDLTLRKLLPALYFLEFDGRLGEGSIYLVTRRTYKVKAFVEFIKSQISQHIDENFWNDEVWSRLAKKTKCLTIDVNTPTDFEKLKKELQPSCLNRVYYCATGSNLYAQISEQLHCYQLIHEHSKIVLEKPIGHDYESAKEITSTVSKYFTESQIYRIDHYLGKETVQNLMVLRFANSLIESQWNQRYIDHIQISISETIGVEKRAEFYDEVGALRDMIQNHLLQLLCITAMEPPAQVDADSVRNEKVKILKALKPIQAEALDQNVIRGQYAEGVVDSKKVEAYNNEPGVKPHSQTETFVALKVEIDNWRWAGVPFYLRTGKRLASRACEIMVQFKEVPHSIFPSSSSHSLANKIFFRLQPDDGVRLVMYEKRTGPAMNVRSVNLSLNSSQGKQKRVPEAYERLLFDVLDSNATLFLRDDELMHAWKWVDPILKHWESKDSEPDSYTAGSWGPSSSTMMLAKDARVWEEQS